MAGKRKSTKKTAPKKKEEVVVEEVEEVIEEVAEEGPKTFKIRFESDMVGKTFIEPGVEYKSLPDRRTEKIKHLAEPFIIRAGETKIVDEETLNYLLKKEAVITQEMKEERDLYRANKLKVKSGRAEPKKDMQTLSDDQKIKLFVELPYVVDEEEE